MVSIIEQFRQSINQPRRLTPKSPAPQGTWRIKITSVICLSLLVCAATPHALAKRKLFEAQLPVVALDPGHGGKDTGAQGPGGTQEKTVTLNLARLIAQRLDADYRVVLTRDDDYGLKNSDRAAAANHARADVFISLHTGNNFVHTSNRSAVYYYMSFQGSAFKTASEVAHAPGEGEPAVRWNTIQTKHRVASKNLALQMQAGLTSIWQQQQVTVREIPMLVLEGADMPATALEIGNLANAGAEKQLADPEHLSKIAAAIARAITAFLAEKPK